ncbi:DUF4351 domain-containing protein [Anabaena sphaerica FACHB-251]|uniref:DUF4351 domain-containing protein n=1 Tax=Anabaena sphaerica FACHB-251 TaxID=2692883 RepID=A0A926WKF7_9NOST|nr:DUF4351 domain-containing protein [Anabaena sphaerica FACHB-251]
MNTRTQQEISAPSNQVIIEIITTIISYKFENLTRSEAEAMLGITLKETRLYRDIKEEGREEGAEQATVNLVMRQLTKRFGELSAERRAEISTLPLHILEDLSEALLDFTSLADLESWLAEVKN